jgi:hypothetical protein
MMTFDEALDNFVNVVQQMINDHYRKLDEHEEN